MNQREKILAVLVGVLIAVVGINFAVKRVIGWFDQRQEQIATIHDALDANEVIVHRGKLARRALDVYDQRSLPSDPVLASSHYRAWLHDWAEQFGIRQEDVKYVFARRKKDVYENFTFSVKCEGDLRQLTQLLFEFYSTDYLHRIKHLGVKRLKGTKLSLAFTIEAMALLDSPPDKELNEMPARRLAFDDVDKYLDVVVARNLFSPANQPPKFASSSHARAYLDEPLSFRFQANDPDDDQISFRLGDHQLEGLTIDEHSGEIEWTPEEKGEFEILVFATDDGMPAKETSQRITVEVTDPPPPEEPAPATPSFDAAAFTFVTAIVEVNDRPQVWLTDRTAGELFKLYEGESFEIGEFQGTVVRIDRRQIEIQAGSERLTVDYGDSLTAGYQDAVARSEN